MSEVPSSCALMGGFAIGERVSLLWQHSAEREMSASACTRSMTGFALVRLAHTARTELHWTQLNLFRTADSSAVRLSSCNVNDVGVQINSTVATLASMLYHFWATGIIQVTVHRMLRGRFLSCLSVYNVGTLWPNVWMDQGVTWYRCIGLGPAGDIVLDGHPAPRKGGQQSPSRFGPRRFGPCLLRPTGRPSQQLLSLVMLLSWYVPSILTTCTLSEYNTIWTKTRRRQFFYMALRCWIWTDLSWTPSTLWQTDSSWNFSILTICKL